MVYTSYSIWRHPHEHHGNMSILYKNSKKDRRGSVDWFILKLLGKIQSVKKIVTHTWQKISKRIIYFCVRGIKQKLVSYLIFSTIFFLHTVGVIPESFNPLQTIPGNPDRIGSLDLFEGGWWL